MPLVCLGTLSPLYLLCTSQTSPPLYNIFLPPPVQLTSKVMSIMLHSVIFLALASVASVSGYSGGPPPSACESMRPGPPHQVIFALEYEYPIFEGVLKIWSMIILKMRDYAKAEYTTLYCIGDSEESLAISWEIMLKFASHLDMLSRTRWQNKRQPILLTLWLLRRQRAGMDKSMVRQAWVVFLKIENINSWKW